MTLVGSTTDCFVTRPVPVGGVNFFALDARSNKEMIDSLRASDHLDFARDAEKAMTQMEFQHDRVMQLVGSSKALARTISAKDGSFRLSIPPTDSVLVFGYEEMEDEAFYFAYKVMGGRANSSFALDMSRGGCGNPSPD